MSRFFSTENCRRFVHVVALIFSLLDHSQPHVGAEHEYEIVLRHINPRRSIAR